MKYDIILLDGMNAVHRAANSYDLGFWEKDTYVPTGIVYGFFQILTSTYRKFGNPGAEIYVCWDAGYDHRIALYPEYKANRRNREPVPEEEKTSNQETFWKQRDALKTLLRIAGVRQARAQGFEADDVMATLSRRFAAENKSVAIYTTDQDLHQCVTERVHVLSAGWGGGKEVCWTPSLVREKWSVSPERVAEVKALIGDGGDNIPGCPKCGMVSAQKLFAAYGSLEGVLKAAGEPGPFRGEFAGKEWKAAALTQNVRDNLALIQVSWELAKVVFDAPVVISEDLLQEDLLRQALQRIEFFSFLEPAGFEILKLCGAREPERLLPQFE
jgi:DNA polymerase I